MEAGRSKKPNRSERRKRKLRKEIESKNLAPVDEGPKEGFVRVQVEYADPDCSLWVDIKGDTPAPQGVMDAIEFGISKFALQLGLNPKDMWGYPTYPCPAEDESTSMTTWEKFAKQPQVIVTGNPESGVVAKQRGIAGLLDDLVLGSSKQQKCKADTDIVMEDEHFQQARLEAEVAELRAEKLQLLMKVDSLETKVEGLESQMVKMKEQRTDMQKQINGFQKFRAGMSPVLVENLLERCRETCREILRRKKIKVSSNWNEVIENPACLAVLQGAGLSGASLQATIVQTDVVHDVNEYLAEVVCRYGGAKRDAFLEIFKFVFGENAESLAFEDPSFFIGSLRSFV